MGSVILPDAALEEMTFCDEKIDLDLKLGIGDWGMDKENDSASH